MTKGSLLRRVSELERMLDDARRDYLALQRENWKLQNKLGQQSKWSGQ
jgi:hypothetical protein